MTDKVAEIKALVAEAIAEAKAINDQLCNQRGYLWWKKKEHEWMRWHNELQKTQHGIVVAYMYTRVCRHCGVQQFREQVIR